MSTRDCGPAVSAKKKRQFLAEAGWKLAIVFQKWPANRGSSFVMRDARHRVFGVQAEGVTR